MEERIDERQFRELMVESDDLQSDAMKGMHSGLNSYVDAALESRYERRRELGIGGAILGAGALGAAALAFAGPAFGGEFQGHDGPADGREHRGARDRAPTRRR